MRGRIRVRNRPSAKTAAGDEVNPVRSVAIIPARGGSRGILRKNLAMLEGKPLVVHAIDAARAAHEIDAVVVSTDDAEIARVARRAGAEVVPRPARLAGSTATSESALLHVLDWLDSERREAPEITVFIQCTSPLTTAEDIDGTVRALIDADADSAVAVTPFHHFLWRRSADGVAEGVNHDQRQRQRRQDAPVQYLETGAVYAMRTEGLREAGHRFFGDLALYVMPRERCWEIDGPTDLVVARALMQARSHSESRGRLPVRPEALVLDFDGVFTDNSVLVFADGTEAVLCHRGDGAGLARLARAGMPVLVLSAEVNEVVKARCDKLGLDCIHGVENKRPQLLAWLDKRGLDSARTIYLGNDLADIPCMETVGCGVAVADAYPEVVHSADLVLRTPGGRGAVRELVDLLLEAAQFQKEASR
jgi:YrbI family 3-deoxy-D-manno-octulosonate 8-phosphate phosphatase